MASSRQHVDQRTQQASSVSATQTQTQTTASASSSNSQPPTAILRLRGGHTDDRRSVQWAEDVVDNEGLGRKSSKVCCIYHPTRPIDESSDESSSDSSSDSDSDSNSDLDRARPSNSRRRPDCPDHNHDHDHDHDHDNARSRRRGKDKKQKRRPSPNAYEKVPKHKPSSGPKGSGSAPLGGSR